MVKEMSKVKRKFIVSEDGKEHDVISRRVTHIKRSKEELKQAIDGLEKVIADSEKEIADTRKACRKTINEAKYFLKFLKPDYEKMCNMENKEIPEGVA